MKKTLQLLLILSSFTISMQGQSWWSSKMIQGNGNLTTTNRTVKKFDNLSVGGSMNVNLIDGKEGYIRIEAEENIMPYIETIVEGRNLKIRFKKNISIRTNKKIEVNVAIEDISSMALGGSGNINVLKTLKEEELSVSISGSGNINLKGKAKSFDAAIAGSGNVSAYKLKAHNVKARIAGSGDIKVTVSDKIKATVVGSGNIYYKGHPDKIDTTSLGSGDIEDRN
ncbi:MAG TPA: DUF2807 domain-containing protein [Tenacibaculum sp.]|nr:DUF2807 domain-containing protein [Tenacibaculum sp.]